MKKFKLHPITKKRLQRFRKVRYAYWSFVALMLLYGLSLFAELLANNRPLLLRYEGKTYVPFLAFYPEDTFTGNGKNTRPDYKQINKLPQFAENSSNYMVFAPIPFGPNETLKPQDVETSRHVTVTFTAQPSTAVLYLNPDWTVDKLRDSEQPTGIRSGDSMTDLFTPSPQMRVALKERFENVASAAFEEIVKIGDKRYKLRFVANEVRSKARNTVRLYMNEALLPLEPMRWKGNEWKIVNPNWHSLPEDIQQEIALQAQKASAGIVDDLSLKIGGTPYLISFDTEQVIFPFRPTSRHLMGLDNAGRDVFALVIYGMRIALSFGILLVISSMAFGTLVGSVQGYYAGKVDMFGQRLIEVWQALPFLYILIMIGSVFGRSFLVLLILYGLFNWIGISYYMRAEFLKLRKMPFVEAARCMGIRPGKIMLKHMLPNALVPLITFFPFSLVGAIGVLAALDYLGFGLPAGTPSWGELLSQAQQARYAWWLIFYPSLALFIVMLLGVFIGEGVRSAFDPKQYNRIEG
jgi:microcin C transport system permease protein